MFCWWVAVVLWEVLITCCRTFLPWAVHNHASLWCVGDVPPVFSTISSSVLLMLSSRLISVRHSARFLWSSHTLTLSLSFVTGLMMMVSPTYRHIDSSLEVWKCSHGCTVRTERGWEHIPVGLQCWAWMWMRRNYWRFASLTHKMIR